MKKLLAIAAIAIPVFLTSCGNDKDKDSEKSKTTEQPATTDNGTAISNTVELQATDVMKYDKTEIRVKAGEKVTLTLMNVGKMPKETMAHNFILLKEGINEADFALKANLAQPDFIPADMTSGIVAHTKLLGPGESETIEFTVPAGSYIYLCSFPGHYPQMSGILIAE